MKTSIWCGATSGKHIAHAHAATSLSHDSHFIVLRHAAGPSHARRERRVKWMLENVNMLYVRVLILQDVSTISRFWTLFEAWLSMQTPTANGLTPAREAERRFEIIPIHLATDVMKDELIKIWAGKTPDEAKDVLASSDVAVTNASDKETQLGKLDTLNDDVTTAFKASSRRDSMSVDEAGCSA